MLELFARLLKVLNAEVSPMQISAGFLFGMVMGLTPLLSISNIALLLILLLLRVNLSAFLLSLTFFSGIGYLCDPLMEQFGAWALNLPALQATWSSLYQVDLWRLLQFNNTLMMGSHLLSLLIAIPMLLVSNFLIRNYRQHILGWVRKTRLMNAVKASKLFGTYSRLSEGGSL